MEGILGYCSPEQIADTIPLYRYWGNSDHFYTLNINEIGTGTAGEIGNFNYVSEGVACYVWTRSKISEIHRYFQPTTNDHFYTQNFDELKNGANGYGYEGIGFKLLQAQVSGSVPLYRYWKEEIHDHFYTTNANEIGTVKFG